MPTRFRRLRPLLAWLPLFVAGALLLAGCGQSSGTDSSEDGPAYALGNPLTDSTMAVIVTSEYGSDTLSSRQYRQQISRQMQRMPPNQRSGGKMQQMHQQTVRQFVGQHVIGGEARASDIQVDSSDVESRLEQLRSRYQDESQFQQQLQRSGITIDSVRSLIAEQLRQRQFQQQLAESAEAPSDSEVESYSQENRRIQVQHILLRAGQNAPQSKVDSARQAAAALIDSAEAGVDFAALARRHSEGPSASRGGRLRPFRRDGQMAEPFAEAAFTLSDSGDVYTEPVKTQFGFHVIRLTDPGEPMDTSRARKQMMQERRRTAVEEGVDELMAEATVRVNPDIVTAGLYEEGDGGSGSSGS